MVLGALPLAMATGAGGESRRQIGYVIVGGMTLGTLLTLFVVPTVYSLMASKRKPLPQEKLVPQAASVAVPASTGTH
jgi:multidrug efflux pump